jgi:hypothetical protein
VFEPGTYGARGVRTQWSAAGTASAPITFIGDPTATTRPQILGYNVLAGAHTRVWNMFFNGPTGQVEAPTSIDAKGEEVMIWMCANDIQVNDSEITNAQWHAGIYVTNGTGDKIQGNYIHDNGDPSDPAQLNEDHGIYWNDGSSGVIADNLIVHNLAHGIQLYANAGGVQVTYNTIANNGKSGVLIGNTSYNNTVAYNIVTGNSDNSIRSFSLTGTGNTVHDNVAWQNGSGNIGSSATGLTMSNNQQADPKYVGSGSFDLQPSSPALGKGAYENQQTAFSF